MSNKKPTPLRPQQENARFSTKGETLEVAVHCPGVFGVGELEDAAESPGVTVRGALTPATSEPNPIFCRLSASSLPVGGKPFADWKRRSASSVLES
ncbi:MAG TPA: hypothetical protein VKB26_00885, partial [Candidatus Acidoferrales bacterium]|nr:hypothetical protein [Candidatus Acidoferrales bacterium]